MIKESCSEKDGRIDEGMMENPETLGSVKGEVDGDVVGEEVGSVKGEVDGDVVGGEEVPKV